jgi:hypothetical protein
MDPTVVGFPMRHEEKINLVLQKIFEILKESNISPEDGMMISSEIFSSALEMLAESKGISIEEVLLKAESINSRRAKPLLPDAPLSNRGWIGNPKLIEEEL